MGGLSSRKHRSQDKNSSKFLAHCDYKARFRMQNSQSLKRRKRRNTTDWKMISAQRNTSAYMVEYLDDENQYNECRKSCKYPRTKLDRARCEGREDHMTVKSKDFNQASKRHGAHRNRDLLCMRCKKLSRSRTENNECKFSKHRHKGTLKMDENSILSNRHSNSSRVNTPRIFRNTQTNRRCFSDFNASNQERESNIRNYTAEIDQMYKKRSRRNNVATNDYFLEHLGESSNNKNLFIKEKGEREKKFEDGVSFHPFIQDAITDLYNQLDLDNIASDVEEDALNKREIETTRRKIQPEARLHKEPLLNVDNIEKLMEKLDIRDTRDQALSSVTPDDELDVFEQLLDDINDETIDFNELHNLVSTPAKLDSFVMERATKHKSDKIDKEIDIRMNSCRKFRNFPS